MNIEELMLVGKYLVGDVTEKTIIKVMEILDRSEQNRAIANIAAACIAELSNNTCSK